VDSETFLDRYPEFDRAENRDLVEQTLAEVAGGLDTSFFGSRFDEAHGAKTGDRLWRSAHGVSLRRDSPADEKSEYEKHYDSIVKALSVAHTMMVI
jgi:hypothetical protein